MAFPTVQSRTTGASSATATSHTVTLPATINSGDLLLIAFTCGGGSGTTVTWDNTTAGTWTEVANGTQSTSVRGVLLSKVANGTEGSAALSITLSTAAQVAWTIWRITGCQGSVESASATGSTATVTFPALTPSWGADDDLWIAIAHINNTPTVSTYSTNYTNATRAAGSGVGRVTTESVERELNASSETPSAWTLSVSNGHVQYTVAIQPAATGLSITSVDTDNAVLASQSQATFAGAGLASTAKFAVKRGSAIAYGADISLSGSTGGSFTAPTMTAMFSAGVRFGDVAFFAAETSGTAIASISGSITTATNWKYVNVTDLSATGSMGSLFYNNAVSLSDQVAYSSVTTRFRWPVTVSGDGYFTVNSSGSQAGDEFAYRIWDETDSTWGTEGTIEVNGGISSAEQVYAAGSLVQASLESSTLEGATLQ